MRDNETHARGICVQTRNSNSPEGSAVRVGALLASPRMTIRTADDPGTAIDEMPVGSVAYVLGGLSARGLRLPDPIDYPESLRPYLRRRIERASLGEVLGQGVWIKHAGHDKPFAPGLANRDPLTRHLVDLPVWVSEPVAWRREYRYYVCRGQLIGSARYDQNPEAGIGPWPNPEVVARMIEVYEASGEAPAGYGIDIGVLESGETALVEVNDGYGLGFYGPVDTLKSRHYLRLLVSRYEELAGLRENRGVRHPAPARAH